MTNLERYASGYQRLDVEEKQALHDFLFLWPLFEKAIFHRNCSIPKIRKIVKQWYSISGLIDNDFWDDELNYFKFRYIHEQYFNDLHLDSGIRKHQDIEKLESEVRKVIWGEETIPKEQLIVILIIIYRYRNNLFHGEKWVYEMKGQKDNFKNAISIMCKILDLGLPPLKQN